MDVEDVRLGTWTISFSTDVLARPSFGGPVTGFHHPPAGAGIVETQPHGTVHVDVGGFNPAGLMSRFHTAPLDPIFWLHHCNIDRLWEVWRNLDRTELPSVTPWLDFRFAFGTDTARREFPVADVRNTTAPPLLYQYEGVPVPALPAGPEHAVEPPVDSEPPPELVGASEEPVLVGPDGGRARVAVEPSTRPPRPEAAGGRRTFVTVENVTGEGLGAGVYAVLLGDREVGRFSTFGLPEASEVDTEHGGSGLTFSYDVTDLVSELEALGGGGVAELEVTVRPTRAVAETVGDISVGRIGVYRE
jgi:tyrosinase